MSSQQSPDETLLMDKKDTDGVSAAASDTEPEISENSPPDKMAASVSILYLLLIAGLASFWLMLAGGLMSYLMRFGAKGKSLSHYVFLIRNFWIQACLIAATYFVVMDFPLTRLWRDDNLTAAYLPSPDVNALFTSTGGVAAGVAALWLLVRYLRGIWLVLKGRAHPSPNTVFW